MLLVCTVLAGCGNTLQRVDIALYAPPEVPATSNAEHAAQQLETEKVQLDTFADELFRLINEERRNNHVFTTLKTSALQELARLRVEELADRFSDIRPGGGHSSTIFDESRELRFFQVVPSQELRARGPKTPRDVLRYWMSRSADKAQLLNPDVTCFAVAGCIKNGKYFWVFVAHR